MTIRRLAIQRPSIQRPSIQRPSIQRPSIQRPSIQRLAGAIALAAAWVSTSPAVAFACSVCMSGRDDETRLAFILTTAFLTFLPFVMVGGLVWWIRRRARELAEAAELGGPQVALDRAAPAFSRSSSSR